MTGTTRLLLVEDERNVAETLMERLRAEGFEVQRADSVASARRAITESDVELALLDVGLPDGNGFELAKLVRERAPGTAIVFLTAHASPEDRVRGLELGADDYMVKPFAFSELLARVRSLLRRGLPRLEEAIRLADLEIDLLRQRATRAGQRLELTAKEFLLLSLLARHAGEVLSRTLIAESVWDMNFDSDTNVVDVNVRRLRSKVDDPFPLKLIHTVRGAGYVLECDA